MHEILGCKEMKNKYLYNSNAFWEKICDFYIMVDY